LKKGVFYTGFEAGTVKNDNIRSTDLPLDHEDKIKIIDEFNLYNLDCVDDQHSHGE